MFTIYFDGLGGHRFGPETALLSGTLTRKYRAPLEYIHVAYVHLCTLLYSLQLINFNACQGYCVVPENIHTPPPPPPAASHGSCFFFAPLTRRKFQFS